MARKPQRYRLKKSLKRIDDVLNQSIDNFKNQNRIPDRKILTYTNGVYVNVCSLFVDIRESSLLTNKHRRPKLAKIYRIYISEIVAILNHYVSCKEINIVGDCVSAVFDASTKNQIGNVFSAACKINSLIKILNYKFCNKQIEPISIGIGMAYGRTLMIKAGYYGSGINDVVWMGDVVNKSSNLCNMANKNKRKVILVDKSVYEKLENNHHKENLTEVIDCESTYKYYEGDIGNWFMEGWYKEKCR